MQSSLVTHHVDAPVEQVWAVLPAVFEELEIPLGFYEEDEMALGNKGFDRKGPRWYSHVPISGLRSEYDRTTVRQHVPGRDVPHDTGGRSGRGEDPSPD